jgi:hypothetical protein
MVWHGERWKPPALRAFLETAREVFSAVPASMLEENAEVQGPAVGPRALFVLDVDSSEEVTFATFHLASGEKPKLIQEILGHSSIKTTMVTYSDAKWGCRRSPRKGFSGFFSALLLLRSHQKRRTLRKAG